MKTSSNPKRKQILATGKELFWKFGFKRVSIEEICKSAVVSKMTFYKYFPNKLELAKSILDEIFNETILKIQKISEEDETPGQKLKKILLLKSEGTRGISEEFIKDLYANPEAGLKSYMEAKTNEMFSEIIHLYEKGKKDGWIRKDLNIPFFLILTRKIIPLLSDDDMLHFFGSSQELIMEITNLFIYGISPHE